MLPLADGVRGHRKPVVVVALDFAYKDGVEQRDQLNQGERYSEKRGSVRVWTVGADVSPSCWMFGSYTRDPAGQASKRNKALACPRRNLGDGRMSTRSEVRPFLASV